MRINSILLPELTRAKLEVSSKKRLLETLAQSFSEQINSDEADAGELFMNLITREKLGSTGIGNGIAIPHSRFATGGQTLCACFTLAEPIDFDAVDQAPVDVIFAMLVPEDAETDHLATLASLAEALQDVNFVKRIRAAKTNDELFTVADHK